MSGWADRLILSAKKSNTSTEQYSLKLNADDWAKVPTLWAMVRAVDRAEPGDVIEVGPVASWSARVTDQTTGQQYDLVGDGDDVIATPYYEPATEDLYTTTVCIGFEPENRSAEALSVELENVRDNAERAIELLKTDSVTLDDFTYDHGWHLLHFSTTDAEIAKENDFDEVLRAGADDFEPAPWFVAGS